MATIHPYSAWGDGDGRKGTKVFFCSAGELPTILEDKPIGRRNQDSLVAKRSMMMIWSHHLLGETFT